MDSLKRIKEMKLLQGYMKNKTQEAALAAMFIAMFFVTRSFSLQVLPFFKIEIAAIFIYTGASLFAWPYTIILTLATMYQASNPIGFIGWFVGMQVVFVLAKLVGKKWAAYTPTIGDLAGWVVYGLTLQMAGVVDFKLFAIASALPQLFYNITTFVGALILWKALIRMKVVD